jgi:hypothetical protein
MTAFLWVMLIIGLIEIGASLAYLSSGAWPQRTRGGIRFNVFAWGAIAVWAICLLVKGGAA